MDSIIAFKSPLLISPANLEPSVSSAPSNAPLGDPKHGGALYRLPREIRDEIYRLLLNGHYRRVHRYSSKKKHICNDANSGFAILRVSKVVSCEATEILYSDSVFRFVITSIPSLGYLMCPNLDHEKRLAPMMKSVILDVEIFGLDIPESVFQRNMDAAVRVFGGSGIQRQSLLIRMFGCDRYLLEGNMLAKVCHSFKAFVGFRTATVVVLLGSCEHEKLGPRYTTESNRIGLMRKWISRITQALAKELESAWGRAISGLGSDAGNVPINSSSVSHVGDTSLIGFLDFQPSKHLAKVCGDGEKLL